MKSPWHFCEGGWVLSYALPREDPNVWRSSVTCRPPTMWLSQSRWRTRIHVSESTAVSAALQKSRMRGMKMKWTRISFGLRTRIIFPHAVEYRKEFLLEVIAIHGGMVQRQAEITQQTYTDVLKIFKHLSFTSVTWVVWTGTTTANNLKSHRWHPLMSSYPWELSRYEEGARGSTSCCSSLHPLGPSLCFPTPCTFHLGLSKEW